MKAQIVDSPPPGAIAPTPREHERARDQSRWVAEYLRNYTRISPAAWWFLLGTMFVSFTWLSFMLLFNLYMRERGYPESVMGRVLSAQSFGTVFFALPVALLVARRSARWLLVLSSIGVGVGYAWVTVAGSVPVIILSAFLAGGMLAASRVLSAPFLMKHSSPCERAHVFSLAFAASLGAGVVAHFGSGSLHRVLTHVSGSSLTAYRWVLWLGCACAALGAIVYTRVPAGVVGQRSARIPWRHFWETKGRLFIRLIFPSFLVGIGAGLIIPFLNLYFRDRFGLSTQMIGIYYGLVQASMIVGVLLGPELARRFGMVRTIVASELLSLPFMVMLAFSHDLTWATVAFLFRGALMNLGVPINNNYLMERVGAEDRAVANSWSMLSWTLAWAVSAFAGGWMIEESGYVLPLLLASGLYLAASVLYYVFFRNEERYAGGAGYAGVQTVDE